jgi:hypothetical protein
VHRGRGGEGGSVAEEFTCEVESPSWMPSYSSACEGLDFYGEHEGKQYCVLHFPSADKDLDEFKEAKDEKLKNNDFKFAGVYFPENLNLYNRTLEGPADFRQATFERGAHFGSATFMGRANFLGATFKGRWADFLGATFKEEAIFRASTFEGEAVFYGVTFESQAEFTKATFMNRANFSGATFKEEAIFTESTFKEGGRFWSLQTTPRTVLSLQAGEIEGPERISFHSTFLHPSWFIGTNVRQFTFTNVQWQSSVNEEIKAIEARRPVDIRFGSSHDFLAKTCEDLAISAEENSDHAQARELYYLSMEASRNKGLAYFGVLNTLYWALSGYGERPRRALCVLVAIFAVFAALYMQVGPSKLQVLQASGFYESIEHAGQALVYSLAVLFRLSPNPKPDPGLFQFLVTIEGIVGPVQIAVLLLAIRRQILRERIFE